jgi:hypothetical protein
MNWPLSPVDVSAAVACATTTTQVARHQSIQPIHHLFNQLVDPFLLLLKMLLAEFSRLSEFFSPGTSLSLGLEG